MRGIAKIVLLASALLTPCTGILWAANAYVNVKSGTPAQGLVYVTKSTPAAKTPSLSEYHQWAPTAGDSTKYLTNSNSGREYYAWEKPARGFEVQKGDAWDNYQSDFSSESTCPSGYYGYGIYGWQEAIGNTSHLPSAWTGVGDWQYVDAGGGQGTHRTVYAKFKAATPYAVRYAPGWGGDYHVDYSYLKTEPQGKDYHFITLTEAFYVLSTDSVKQPTGQETPVNTNSYAADSVTLRTSAPNFIGWCENGLLLSTDTLFVYPVTKSATVTARFKYAQLGKPTGDLKVKLFGLGSSNHSVSIPITAVGDWSTEDFTVTFTDELHRGDVSLDSISYADGVLFLPYTYNPTSFGGSRVQVKVVPAFGDAVQFTILAEALEQVPYQASVWENNLQTKTGSLADMVAYANTRSTIPVIKLQQDVSLSAPLSLKKSLAFDLNDLSITSKAQTAFSIDTQGIEVQLVDNGSMQDGHIIVADSIGDTVSVVRFAQKGKLTLLGGTLSARNNGAGPAYGLNIAKGSIFYMSGGQLVASAANRDARGINVATIRDYATLQGGSVAASAPTRAYGIYSTGQSNVDRAVIEAETSTGSEAYGVFVDGGVTNLVDDSLVVSSEMSHAYGAYVNAGRLNSSASSFSVLASTSDASGASVQPDGTASFLQNTIVTKATTGTHVRGVESSGSLTLSNSQITATSPSADAIAVHILPGAQATTIEEGSYLANGEGGRVYGLFHQAGSLTVDGAVFQGIGGGDSVYGGCSTVACSITNASFLGETQGTSKLAYGFAGKGTAADVTLTNCNFNAKSATSDAVALYSKANLTATDCHLSAQTVSKKNATACLLDSGTNVLNRCSAEVYSYANGAYGINQKSGNVAVTASSFSITASQATARGEENSELFGVKNSATSSTTLTNTTFTLSAPNSSYSKSAYGVYALGKLTSTGSSYAVDARKEVFGMLAKGSSSRLNLSSNTITARAGSGATAYGVYAEDSFLIDGDIVTATSTTPANVESAEAYGLFFTRSARGSVREGKFAGIQGGSATYGFGSINDAAPAGSVVLWGGVYRTPANLDKYAADGYQQYHLDDSQADYAAGYRFKIATENPCSSVCYILGGNTYPTLEAALQFTQDNPDTAYTIILTQPYTLAAGDYILPAKATLIIPYKASHTTIAGKEPFKRTSYGVREEYIRLTLANNAHLDVNGKIEVGGEQYCQESGLLSYVYGPYGRIHLEEGSLIQINSGAVLYAWGYVTGKGDVRVKNNGEVHEMFTLGNLQNYNTIVDYYSNAKKNTAKFFPLNQYFIQNVEAPTTYYYNARLIGSMNSYYNFMFFGDDDINIVGDTGSLFVVTDNNESSWVRKTYDPESDYQVWDINSAAALGYLKITICGVPISSTDYILPLTSNMKIHILDGEFHVWQDAQYQPGTKLEVNKTGTLTQDPGTNFYLFDKDQWPASIQPVQTPFSPSWTGDRPVRTTSDVELNVHGRINALGHLYTSKKTGSQLTDGANIFSCNADAGTFYFSTAAPADTTMQLVTGLDGSYGNYTPILANISMESAKLRNTDSSYTATTGTAAGCSFIFKDDRWQKSYTNGCFEVIGDTVFAKPAEYVALKHTQLIDRLLTGVEEADHTYLTCDNRHLILLDNCQWEELDSTYVYNDSTGLWEQRMVTITFYADEAATRVLKQVPAAYTGIPDQSVIAANPTKTDPSGHFIYSFYGWRSSLTQHVYNWTTSLEQAMMDMSYTPAFREQKRNYTLTLLDAQDGQPVEVEVPYGDTLQYTPTRSADAQYTYSFSHWSPTLQPVTARATYTAIWDSTVNTYTLLWLNGSQVLQVDSMVPYGTTPEYKGPTPTRRADAQYAYTFSGWDSLPMREGWGGSSAHFTTTPRYLITFQNYDGTILSRSSFTEGETPVYNGTPARLRDADGYFVFSGWRNSQGQFFSSSELPAASSRETYTAQYAYTNTLRTITLLNVDGNNTSWSGQFGEGSTPFYNPNGNDIPVTPSKDGDEQYVYDFTGWSPALEPVSATSPTTYTAQFTRRLRTCTVSFHTGADALIGAPALTTPDPITIPYGDTITLPILTTEGYNFLGWYTLDGDSVGRSYSPPYEGGAGGESFYAHWSPQTYTISFLPGLGSGTMPDLVYSYGEEPTLPACTFTPPTYTVLFDENHPNAPITTETCQGTFKSWSIVTPPYGGGAGGEALAQWLPGTVLMPTPQPRLGYAFDGWYNDPTLGSLMGIAGDSYSPPSDGGAGGESYLYARWRPLYGYTYTLEVYVMDTLGNYPSVPDTSAVIIGFTDQIIPVDSGNKEGFTRLSIATSPTILPTNDALLTCYYQRNKYFVTWLVDADTLRSTETDSFTCDSAFYGTTLIYPNTIPTKEGYLFTGWQDQSTISSQQSTITTVPAYDLTFLAQWQQQSPATELEALTPGSRILHLGNFSLSGQRIGSDQHVPGLYIRNGKVVFGQP